MRNIITIGIISGIIIIGLSVGSMAYSSIMNQGNFPEIPSAQGYDIQKALEEIAELEALEKALQQENVELKTKKANLENVQNQLELKIIELVTLLDQLEKQKIIT